jgi:hypothetical protein
LSLSKDEEKEREEVKNVYSLPSIPQSIRYLHAAAGFPVEATWIKAIKREISSHGQGSPTQQLKNAFQSLTKQ